MVMVVEAPAPKHKGCPPTHAYPTPSVVTLRLLARYWDPAEPSADGSTKEDGKQPPELKFELEMDFGELHHGKSSPQLLVYDWQRDVVSVVAPKLPEHSYPAHPIFSEHSGTGLIFTVYRCSHFCVYVLPLFYERAPTLEPRC